MLVIGNVSADAQKAVCWIAWLGFGGWTRTEDVTAGRTPPTMTRNKKRET